MKRGHWWRDPWYTLHHASVLFILDVDDGGTRSSSKRSNDVTKEVGKRSFGPYYGSGI